MKICNVVGARPNFMKMAPVVLALKERGIEQILVHTGQHYDPNMSALFFEELGMPAPDLFLGIGSDSHARQTARIMIAFEEICLRERPGLVLVGGDVNSTMAVALVAAKLQIPVGHVESGLRSFDRAMPEEVNRVVTDHLSSLLFTSEEDGNVNLAREGVPAEKVHFVGNCMVDTLLKHITVALDRKPWAGYGVEPDGFVLLTLHRPSNVDDPANLARLIGVVNHIAAKLPVLFPVHPRTRERLKNSAVPVSERVLVVEPLSYLTFVGLMARSRCVLTDSGGIQEETTALGVPCLTLRHNTERPSTLKYGTNTLVGTDPERIRSAAAAILDGLRPSGQRPPLWDGHAADRIVSVIEETFCRQTASTQE